MQRELVKFHLCLSAWVFSFKVKMTWLMLLNQFHFTVFMSSTGFFFEFSMVDRSYYHSLFQAGVGGRKEGQKEEEPFFLGSEMRELSTLLKREGLSRDQPFRAICQLQKIYTGESKATSKAEG